MEPPQQPPLSDVAASAAHIAQTGWLPLQAAGVACSASFTDTPRDQNIDGTSKTQQETELRPTTDASLDAQPSSPTSPSSCTTESPRGAVTGHGESPDVYVFVGSNAILQSRRRDRPHLGLPSPELKTIPNEILTHILSHLEISDLLATSRTSHHLRSLSLQPILRALRLQRVRTTLPPLLTSPTRPTLTELVARHIVLTNTTHASRRLGRNLVAIRLSRRLPQRPSAEILVQRGVLPPECVEGSVAPGLVARKRAVEKEKLKDGLRHWVGGSWRGEVRERGEGVRRCDERLGTGRVWRLRKFWERVAGGETVV